MHYGCRVARYIIIKIVDHEFQLTPTLLYFYEILTLLLNKIGATSGLEKVSNFTDMIVETH